MFIMRMLKNFCPPQRKFTTPFPCTATRITKFRNTKKLHCKMGSDVTKRLVRATVHYACALRPRHIFQTTMLQHVN